MNAATAGQEIDALEIRPVRTVEEYHGCEELQRRAWGFETDLDVVPLTQLVAAAKSGGIVLGAFDARGEMRGFTYGFLGQFPDGRRLVYSHMTAVDPALKAAGLGRRLKWAQRDAALERGIDLMVWTYDPLESLNGYFNFSKLGVIAADYWPNLYGETSSHLHRGTPTDRLRADWYLSAARVRSRREGRAGALAASVATDPTGYPAALAALPGEVPRPGEVDTSLTAAHLLCEVPADIQRVKREDPAAALAWRLATRELMTHYLNDGYFVRECVRTRETPSRTVYVLERGTPGPLDD